MLKSTFFKIYPFFVLSLGILLTLFYFIDPLGSPDTIRYFNFADFLINPNKNLQGDLAVKNGILYMSLFLPTYLAIFKGVFNIPFKYSGMFLQLISLTALFIGVNKISTIITDKRNTLICSALLILTLPIYYSFIITEIIFFPSIIWFLYFCYNKNKVNLYLIITLALLIISIRDQGIIIIVVVSLHLFIKKRISIRQIIVIILSLILYFSFNNLLFKHLNKKYPNMITQNLIFTQSQFSLKKSWANYNYKISGVKALTENITIVSFILKKPIIYLRKLKESSLTLLKGLTNRQLHIGLFLILSLSIIYLMRKRSSLFYIFFITIILNIMILVVSLTPPHAFIRYVSIIFPFTAIVLTLFFLKNDSYKMSLLKPIILVSLIVYFGVTISYFANLLGFSYKLTHRNLNNQIATKIETIVGTGNYISTSNTLNYGFIYNSSNYPVYFNPNWSSREIKDYLEKRNSKWLISDQSVYNFFVKQKIEIREKYLLATNHNDSNRYLLYKIYP